MSKAIAINPYGFFPIPSSNMLTQNSLSIGIISNNTTQTRTQQFKNNSEIFVIESTPYEYNINRSIADWFMSKSGKIIDINKNINLSKIDKLATLKNNWNGYGGKRFKKGALQKFRSIISFLDIQPDIAPTGRGSLYIQFEHNGSTLAFEIFEDCADKVLVLNGDYSKLETEHIHENIEYSIKKIVDNFYEHTKD